MPRKRKRSRTAHKSSDDIAALFKRIAVESRDIAKQIAPSRLQEDHNLVAEEFRHFATTALDGMTKLWDWLAIVKHMRSNQPALRTHAEYEHEKKLAEKTGTRHPGEKALQRMKERRAGWSTTATARREVERANAKLRDKGYLMPLRSGGQRRRPK